MWLPLQIHKYSAKYSAHIPSLSTKIYHLTFFTLCSLVVYTLSRLFSLQSFSKQIGEPSITGRNLAKQSLMGQRDSLGYYDIKAVNHHYGCRKQCTNRLGNILPSWWYISLQLVSLELIRNWRQNQKLTWMFSQCYHVHQIFIFLNSGAAPVRGQYPTVPHGALLVPGQCNADAT